MRWAHAVVYGGNKVQHKLQTKQPERRLMASSSISSTLSVFLTLSLSLLTYILSLSLSLFPLSNKKLDH